MNKNIELDQMWEGYINNSLKFILIIAFTMSFISVFPIMIDKLDIFSGYVGLFFVMIFYAIILLMAAVIGLTSFIHSFSLNSNIPIICKILSISNKRIIKVKILSLLSFITLPLLALPLYIYSFLIYNITGVIFGILLVFVPLVFIIILRNEIVKYYDSKNINYDWKGIIK